MVDGDWRDHNRYAILAFGSAAQGRVTGSADSADSSVTTGGACRGRSRRVYSQTTGTR